MAAEGRENWTNQLQFLFSAIGVSVGLGNIWRFPYVCYRNGGGAFLVPYVLFLLILGFPLTLLQMTYAQYSNRGPTKVWECCPLFKGVGYMMVLLIFIVLIYYNNIICWTLYYLCMSMQSTLPWSNCDNAWNTDDCYRGTSQLNDSISTFANKSIDNYINITDDGNSSFTEGFSNKRLAANATKTPAEEFWEYQALEISDGIGHLGSVRWQLLLCNLVLCIAIFLCVFKGTKVFGKIMYLAASLPYVFLTILLIRGLTLPGAANGIKFFFIPRWEELLRISVWVDAAIQVLYSLGFAGGALVVLASYNRFDHNLYRDAIVLPIVDVVTSLFGGCVVFVTLGYMAESSGVTIDKVVTDGPGLAFMVYPEVLATLPLPQLWTCIFFAMLCLVGLDSQIVHAQIAVSSIGDSYPHIFRTKTMWSTAGVCLFAFILGIPGVTQGGVYVVQLLDWYIAAVDVLLVSLLEVVGLVWVYGANRLYKDLEHMLGYRVNPVWKWLWKIILPICLLMLWLFSIVQHRPVKYGDLEYPTWAIGIGWCIGIFPLISYPLAMFHTLKKQKGTMIQRLRAAIKPTAKWKPALSSCKDGTRNNEIEIKEHEKMLDIQLNS